MEINKIGNSAKIKKMNETKARSLRISIKLLNLQPDQLGKNEWGMKMRSYIRNEVISSDITRDFTLLNEQ